MYQSNRFILVFALFRICKVILCFLSVIKTYLGACYNNLSIWVSIMIYLCLCYDILPIWVHVLIINYPMERYDKLTILGAR